MLNTFLTVLLLGLFILLAIKITRYFKLLKKYRHQVEELKERVENLEKQ